MLSTKSEGKEMKRWFCAIGLALSLGCATAVVRPYVGDQQAWPTASGGIVNTKYQLPVFTSLPPSPYEVIAEMRISSPFYAQPEEGHMPRLVKRAREIGADALLFVQGRVFFSTNYGPRGGNAEQPAGGQTTPTLTTVNTFNPESFAPEVTILAIRWTDGAPPGLPSHEKTSPVVATPPVAAPILVPAATDTNAASQLPPLAVTDTNAAPRPVPAPVPPVTDQTTTPPVTLTNTPPSNPTNP
jgi:hypothetical protein